MARNLIIGTAGHIDHGKTVLVKALTGRDTDRLSEEKERGISIDLGFAPLELPDGSRLGLVDVPGHENFVRNMMAGATGMDLALLVVAADDGVMPQTREHLAIINYLGISRGVVAITKTDLADDELIELVQQEVEELLEGTILEGSPMVPVSARTGEGINRLLSVLQEQSARVRLRDENLPARLPVDRVFTLKGIGTVATGTLWSGSIRPGDQLVALPSGLRARVRSLHVHDEMRREAYAGERVAINLAGISRGAVLRGDMLAEPGRIRPGYMVDVRLSVLKDWTRPLKRGSRVRFHHGTREILGRVYPLNTDAVLPGKDAAVQIRLEARAACAPGDRFVLRSYTPVTTMGGGVVVDTSPEKHRLDDKRALADFKALESGTGAEKVAVYLTRSQTPLTPDELSLKASLPPGPVQEGLGELVRSSRAIVLDGTQTGRSRPSSPVGSRSSAAVRSQAPCISMDTYRELETGALKELKQFHRERPLAEGMERETLKRKLMPGWDPRLAELALSRLEAARIVESGGTVVHLPGAGTRVTGEQEHLLEDLAGRIHAGGASPPALGDIASGLSMEKKGVAELLEVAARDKRLIRVSPDLYFSPEVIAGIKDRLVASIDEGGITVSSFKEMIGTTRKYALPLLEYFDRNRVTVRVGDVRKLR